MANEKGKGAATEKKLSGNKWLVAKVNLKGDFEIDDGLGKGEKAVDVSAGHKFRTEDADLQGQLIDQGYAKLFNKNESDDDTDVAASGDGTTGPKIKS